MAFFCLTPFHLFTAPLPFISVFPSHLPRPSSSSLRLLFSHFSLYWISCIGRSVGWAALLNRLHKKNFFFKYLDHNNAWFPLCHSPFSHLVMFCWLPLILPCPSFSLPAPSGGFSPSLLRLISSFLPVFDSFPLVGQSPNQAVLDTSSPPCLPAFLPLPLCLCDICLSVCFISECP